ncbi:MAG TPA: TMEM175 family protein [Gemmatimonadaceae bacterium]|nr:TMEM175 family protein [Gemmatimonadaceae bacterium]
MSKGRMEAFSDGVIAILITIMVLNLRVPAGSDWGALHTLVPDLLAYGLSFIFLGIYWNNHHHLLHATERINGAILWANLHLLFWLSLIPFATRWVASNLYAAVPAAVYGLILLFAGAAYRVLLVTILAAQGPDSTLATAVGGDVKGWVSVALYAAAVPLAFLNPWIADAIYAIVALMWLVPDRRIETRLAS